MRRSTRRNRWALRIAAMLIVVIGGVAPFMAASGANKPQPPSTGRVGPLSFDGQVHQVGINNYSDIYAGVEVNSDGAVTIYVTAHDAVFSTKVAQLDVNDVPYSFSIVSRSFQSLTSQTKALAHQSSALAVAGIHLMEVEPDPDPAASKVNVWLGVPTSADLAALAKAAGNSSSAVTLTNYREAVEAYLTTRFGAGINVQGHYQKPATRRHRRNDIPPYYGGDNICNLVAGVVQEGSLSLTTVPRLLTCSLPGIADSAHGRSTVRAM